MVYSRTVRIYLPLEVAQGIFADMQTMSRYVGSVTFGDGNRHGDTHIQKHFSAALGQNNECETFIFHNLQHKINNTARTITNTKWENRWQPERAKKNTSPRLFPFATERKTKNSTKVRGKSEHQTNVQHSHDSLWNAFWFVCFVLSVFTYTYSYARNLCSVCRCVGKTLF